MNEVEIMRKYQRGCSLARKVRDAAIDRENRRHEITVMRLQDIYTKKIKKWDYWLNTTEPTRKRR